MNGRLARVGEQAARAALTGVYALSSSVLRPLKAETVRDLFNRVVAIPTGNLVSGRNAAGQQEILVGV